MYISTHDDAYETMDFKTSLHVYMLQLFFKCIIYYKFQMLAADQSFDISDRDIEPHADDDSSFDVSGRDIDPVLPITETLVLHYYLVICGIPYGR